MAVGGSPAGCAPSRRAGDSPQPAGTGPTSSSSRPADRPSPAPTRTAAGGVLLAFFSRAGENYYHGTQMQMIER